MPWRKRFDRETVLETAMAAFWAHGFEATSVADLVAATGVNRASLYDTYGDKRSLFLAALGTYADRHRRALAEFAATLAPRAALRAPFEALVAQAEGGSPGSGCFLTNSALERAAHDPEVRRIVADAQAATEAFFARTIAAAGAAADVETAARGMLAALLGVAVLARSRPDPAVLRGAVEGALAALAPAASFPLPPRTEE